MKSLWIAFRRVTTPTENQVKGLERRLKARGPLSLRSRNLLDGVGHVQPEDVERLQVLIQRRQQTRRRRNRVAAGALLLALALVGVALVPGASTPPAVAELDAPLASAAPALLEGKGFALDYDGEGRLGGVEDAPDVRWEAGRLAASVDPQAGLDFEVRTAEAIVRVVGTRFEVERDVFGTRVHVQSGKVAVTCLSGGAAGAIEAGQTAVCLPVTSEGRLARARALWANGARRDVVLAEIDAALSGAAIPATRDELTSLKVEVLVADGDHEAALAALRPLVENPDGARHSEAVRLNARLLYTVGGCERVRPALERLAAFADEEEWALIEACAGPGPLRAEAREQR